jgi:hypothetical protein
MNFFFRFISTTPSIHQPLHLSVFATACLSFLHGACPSESMHPSMVGLSFCMAPACQESLHPSIVCLSFLRVGACAAVHQSVEALLRQMRVRYLVLPAMKQLLPMWTRHFGYQPLTEAEAAALEDRQAFHGQHRVTPRPYPWTVLGSRALL